jgi:hypothetical protein
MANEVSFGCAAGVPAIKSWLVARNMSASELLPYFWRRVTAEVAPPWGSSLTSNAGYPGLALVISR